MRSKYEYFVVFPDGLEQKCFAESHKLEDGVLILVDYYYNKATCSTSTVFVQGFRDWRTFYRRMLD